MKFVHAFIALGSFWLCGFYCQKLELVFAMGWLCSGILQLICFAQEK